MKKITLVTVFLAGILTSFSQVGIGTNTPDANSILDLTNTVSKGLVLPSSTGAIPAGIPDGWLIFNRNDSVIYLNEGGGNINALTPWKFKFNGSVSNDTYFNQTGGNVGIGIANPPTKLTIDGGTDAQGSTGGNGYLLIGNFAGSHLVMDNNEIIAKSDPNTSATLNLQNDGGTVAIGATSAANLTVSRTIDAGGNINTTGRIREDNVDLLPAGAICMWAGTAAPAGWGLCNGGTYTKTDGTGTILTPDLRGRFIVGYNPSDGDYNDPTPPIADTGGEKFHTLSISEMPSHTHTGVTDTSGAHTHNGNFRYTADNDDNDHAHLAIGNNVKGFDGHGAATIYSDGSEHEHPFTTDSRGGGSPHENRPPYYTLAYIMKL